MALFSSNLFTPNSKTLPFLSLNSPLLPKTIPISSPHPLLTANAAVSSSAATTSKKTSSSWKEFAERVSGEWDGFGADFTASGDPIELPENVVPDAYREWDIRVFDWQTQCPTLGEEKASPFLHYKLIKLLPTVGCEADAATRYSVEERVVGGPEGMARAFAFDSKGGCYVAVWELGKGGLGFVELEHCFVDPRDREMRVRVIQVVRMEEGGMKLEKIRVFCEHWDGPFRNGESLGGCALKEASFASTAKVELGEVVGDWQGKRIGVADLQNDTKEIFHELVAEELYESARDQLGIVTLPKRLWCSVKEIEGGLRLCEVGWLLSHNDGMISSCVLDSNGKLKEVSIGRERAIPEEV